MTGSSDFTQGSILKKLSLFMLPVLGALILQAAYGAVLIARYLGEKRPEQIGAVLGGAAQA